MKINKFIVVGCFSIMAYLFLVFDVLYRRLGGGYFIYICGLSGVVLFVAAFVKGRVWILLWSLFSPVLGSFLGYGLLMISFLLDTGLVHGHGKIENLFVWFISAYIINSVWLLSIILLILSFVFMWFDRKR
ncbi:hypothetical protein D9M68_509770 [compost metagenome]